MIPPDQAQPLCVIVLAAGDGTRMKSRRPKVLHPIGGRAMLSHVLAAAGKLEPINSGLVLAPGMEEVAVCARQSVPEIQIFTQKPALGTAHAVLAARKLLQGLTGDVLILYGDTPLIRPETLGQMIAARRAGAGVVVLGFHAQDPGAYGRLVVSPGGALSAIVEASEADAATRALTFCNSGVVAVEGAVLMDLLDAVGRENAKGEYYLTDIIAIAREKGIGCVTIEGQESEVLGVNSRAELAQAESIFQERMRRAALDHGVTLSDPSTVYFSHDTELARDVWVAPHVVFGPGVRVGEGAAIHAFSHLEGADVAPQARIGPFARLRPGAEIGPDVHIGNFVEVKKSVIEEGAKVNHLTYIGDTFIGAGANIGAGTITCNYDGFDKYQTHIGKGASIGSNNSLVAPVTIGDGAYTGSGSVIRKDVEANALALSDGKQKSFPQWAEKFRARKSKSR